DRLLFRLGGAAQLGVEVEVERLVILVVALAEDLVARELVERRQDVAQPQDRAEERDEHLRRALAEDRLVEREQRLQFADALGVLLVVVGVRLEQYDAARVLVAEERERIVRLLLQIAERDDVAVDLYGVEDPVRARVRLNETVRAETLVDPERV